MCKSLVVDLDRARLGEVLRFVYNNGDQVSNLDTDLKGTQPSG